MKSTIQAVVVVVIMFAGQASAQWAKHADKSMPRTPNGKPNLSAPAPKGSDGKVDLSGVWLPDVDPDGSPQGVEHMVFPKHFVNITADMKPQEVPIQPWARDLLNQRLQNDGKDDPAAHCKPTGTPAVVSVPVPHKIVQTPQLILILYEEGTVFRQIFLDDRQTVQDPEPRWMGYSKGRWEGDTLVVDTVGFNDQSWLDRAGHPHTEALHVIERYRRRDFGHIDIEVAVDDPKAYTKPITYTQKTTLVPEEDLLEYFCSENEKDVQLFK